MSNTPYEKLTVAKAFGSNENAISRYQGSLVMLIEKSVDSKVFDDALDQIPPELFFEVVATNYNGETLFHRVAANAKLLKALITRCLEARRLEAIQARNGKAVRALELIRTVPESFRALLQTLSDEQCEKLLATKIPSGKILIHSALGHPNALNHIVLSLATDKARLTALSICNKNQTPLIHAALNKAPALKVLLTSISDAVFLSALKIKNANGVRLIDTIVQLKNINTKIFKRMIKRATHSAKLFFDVLSLLPEKNRYAFLTWKNAKGERVLFSMLAKPSYLEKILPELGDGLYNEAGNGVFDTLWKTLSVREQVASTKLKDMDGNTLLHIVADKIGVKLYCYNEKHCIKTELKLFKAILSAVPVNERLAALLNTNNAKKSPLSLAYFSSEFIDAALELLPKSDWLAFCRMSTQPKQNLFHKIVDSPELIGKLLPSIPEHQRFDLLTQKNSDGKTVLHLALDHKDSFKLLLESLPKKQRLPALQIKSTCGHSVFIEAAKHPDCIPVILNLYPRGNRLKLLQSQRHEVDNFLHVAAGQTKHNALEQTLAQLSKADRVRAINTQNKYSRTPAQIAISSLPSFNAITKLVPRKACIKAFNTQDECGTSAFESAVQYPDVCQAMVAFYTRGELMAAANCTDTFGLSTLHKALRHPRLLDRLIKALGKQEILKWLNQQGESRHGALESVGFDLLENNDLIDSIKYRGALLLALLRLLPKDKHMTLLNKVGKKKLARSLKNATEQPDELIAILRWLPAEYKLDKLKNYQLIYHCVLLSLQLIIERRPELLDKTLLAAIVDESHDGETRLLKAKGNSEDLRALLHVFPHSKELSAFNITGSMYISQFESMAASIDEIDDDADSAFDAKGRDHEARGNYDKNRMSYLSNPGSYNDNTHGVILAFLNPEKQPPLPQEEKPDRTFHYNDIDERPLREALEGLSIELRFDFIARKNREGQNLVSRVIEYPKRLEMLFEGLSLEQKLHLINDKDNDGLSAFDYAANHYSAFMMFLALLPEKEHKATIRQILHDKPGLLPLVVKGSGMLSLCFSVLTKKEQLAMAARRDDKGNTSVHLAASNSKSVQIFLELYPAQERPAIVLQKNNAGENLLHAAAYYPETLKQILALLPADQHLAAIKACDNRGRNVLAHTQGGEHKTTETKSVELLLAHYPEHERFNALKALKEALGVRYLNYDDWFGQSTIVKLFRLCLTPLIQATINTYLRDELEKNIHAETEDLVFKPALARRVQGSQTAEDQQLFAQADLTLTQIDDITNKVANEYGRQFFYEGAVRSLAQRLLNKVILCPSSHLEGLCAASTEGKKAVKALAKQTPPPSVNDKHSPRFFKGKSPAKNGDTRVQEKPVKHNCCAVQ